MLLSRLIREGCNNNRKVVRSLGTKMNKYLSGIIESYALSQFHRKKDFVTQGDNMYFYTLPYLSALIG